MNDIVSLSASSPEATRSKNEEERSNVSDQSYCVEALLTFGDEEPCQQTKSLNQSHDSEITQLVSNTAAAVIAVQSENAGASSAAASAKSSPLALVEPVGHHSLSALASLLEQATSLTSDNPRRGKTRSNSIDLKQRSRSFSTTESNKTMYASVPNLDFFNAFDQDPHLSDTETAEHPGSWWNDSEHTHKIVAPFAAGKSFKKSYRKSPATSPATYMFSPGASPSCKGQQYGPDKVVSSPSASPECEPSRSKQDFWLDETDSSVERLSHSLHSIQKEFDQRRLKSDGTVKTNSTDMAVALPRSSVSALAEKLSLRDGEADTVATGATRTVTSRDSAQSSIIMTPTTQKLSVSKSLGTSTSSIATRKSPNRASARPTKPVTKVGGQNVTTPVTCNKKKKVIKVRVAELKSKEGEMDPEKVQDALKNWKLAKKQNAVLSGGTADASPATPRTPVKKMRVSKKHSPHLEDTESVDRVEASPTGDGNSRRSQRVCGADPLVESSLSSEQLQRPRSGAVSEQSTPGRSGSQGRARQKDGSASSLVKPTSRSTGPIRQLQNSHRPKPGNPGSARSLAHQNAQPTTILTSGVSSTQSPTEMQKLPMEKTSTSGHTDIAQESRSNSRSLATMTTVPDRGRSRATNSTPTSKARSLSLGRGIVVSPPTAAKDCSTRSTVSGALSGELSGEASRTRSRSLGKIGNSLFRRRPLENAVSVIAESKGGSTGFLAALTQAVTRTPRGGAQPNESTSSAPLRSKSLPRLRQTDPASRSMSLPRLKRVEQRNSQPDHPFASPPSPEVSVASATRKPPPQTRRAMRNVSTRAICPAPPRSPSDTGYSSPRSHRPIPPQDYIPCSIELSPNIRSSRVENNEHSVVYDPASAETEADQRAEVNRRELLERTMSDLSDDALFRRIRSAGVTDEMMSKLRGMGLIITEATPSLVGRIVEGKAPRM